MTNNLQVELKQGVKKNKTTEDVEAMRWPKIKNLKGNRKRNQ